MFEMFHIFLKLYPWINISLLLVVISQSTTNNRMDNNRMDNNRMDNDRMDIDIT